MTDTDHMSLADKAMVYEGEYNVMDNFSMDFTNNTSSPEDTWDAATIDMWVVLIDINTRHNHCQSNHHHKVFSTDQPFVFSAYPGNLIW